MVLASTAMAAPATDEVKSLPGWSGPLPSKHYSGFLDASPRDHLHYVFVEAAVNPATAPVRLRPFLPLCLSVSPPPLHPKPCQRTTSDAPEVNVATSTAFPSCASLTFTPSLARQHKWATQQASERCNVNCVSFMYLSHHHLHSTQSKPRQTAQVGHLTALSLMHLPVNTSTSSYSKFCLIVPACLLPRWPHLDEPCY
jgi:hypothetical protein